MIKKNRAAKI